MEFAMWILVGGVVGWIGFSFLKFNVTRGMVVSIVIGMVAGFLGGARLAPLLSAATAHAGDFNPFSLFMAFASAAGCLIICNMVHKRFGW